MNCLVCVKQVPDTEQIKIDPVRHTMIREGVAAILNPYDAYALETALGLKDACGGAVWVLSMGPPQAERMLQSCLAVGAEGAYLVSGRAFSASDTLATSYILAAAVAEIQKAEGLRFDLILCGKQAIDGDTGQVGPALAEHLDLAQITCARDVAFRDGELLVTRQTATVEEVLQCAAPAVVTMSATQRNLRLPTVRGKLAAQKKAVKRLDEQSLPLDLARCGLSGSPTRVIATTTYPMEGHCTLLTGDDPAAALAQILEEAGLPAGRDVT